MEQEVNILEVLILIGLGNNMTIKQLIKEGVDVKVLNYVKAGLEMADICIKLNLRYETARKLLYNAMSESKPYYEPMIRYKLELSLAEYALEGESYKSLYIPYYEEKQTYTVMSKV